MKATFCYQSVIHVTISLFREPLVAEPSTPEVQDGDPADRTDPDSVRLDFCAD